jgi:hypothetical protein
LTSFEARQKLHDLKTADPESWDELTQRTNTDPLADDSVVEDDDDTTELVFDDNSDLLCEVIITTVLGTDRAGIKTTADGNLVSMATAESMDDIGGNNSTSAGTGTLGRSKRTRMKNSLYNSDLFWRHNNAALDEKEDE